MFQFGGLVVTTSDAGLLASRKLDRLGVTVMASETLADMRTGKNGRHALVGLLRRSVFGRLVGLRGRHRLWRARRPIAKARACGRPSTMGVSAQYAGYRLTAH
jgi:hypothetical protein